MTTVTYVFNALFSREKIDPARASGFAPRERIWADPGVRDADTARHDAGSNMTGIPSPAHRKPAFHNRVAIFLIVANFVFVFLQYSHNYR
jgi:hypothetical protein